MNASDCATHSFQGICGEPCPWCRLEKVEASARMVAENFTLYDSQINVLVPMDLIERLQHALSEQGTTSEIPDTTGIGSSGSEQDDG